jgi:hypothetical protein
MHPPVNVADNQAARQRMDEGMQQSHTPIIPVPVSAPPHHRIYCPAADACILIWCYVRQLHKLGQVMPGNTLVRNKTGQPTI